MPRTLFAVVLLGTLLQVSIGFGLGLLGAPVIALFAPELVPVILLLATAVTASVLLLDRAHVHLRGAGWALLGRVPGVIAGAALVAVLPTRWLALLVAAVVVLGVVASVRGFRPVPTRRAVVLAGMASGLMGTATSIGGPPMALVWQRMKGAELRSTMSGFFLVGSVMSLIALTAVGAVHTDSLRCAALLAPAAAAGVLLARPLSDRPLPVGLLLMAGNGQDADLLTLGAAVEHRLDGRQAPRPADAPGRRLKRRRRHRTPAARCRRRTRGKPERVRTFGRVARPMRAPAAVGDRRSMNTRTQARPTTAPWAHSESRRAPARTSC